RLLGEAVRRVEEDPPLAPPLHRLRQLAADDRRYVPRARREGAAAARRAVVAEGDEIGPQQGEGLRALTAGPEQVAERGALRRDGDRHAEARHPDILPM